MSMGAAGTSIGNDVRPAAHLRERPTLPQNRQPTAHMIPHCDRGWRTGNEAGADIRSGCVGVGAYMSASGARFLSSHRHRYRRDADERARASGGSRPGQVRRNAVHDHLRELPSQPARPRGRTGTAGRCRPSYGCTTRATPARRRCSRPICSRSMLLAARRNPGRTREERTRAVAASAGVVVGALVLCSRSIGLSFRARAQERAPE